MDGEARTELTTQYLLTPWISLEVQGFHIDDSNATITASASSTEWNWSRNQGASSRSRKSQAKGVHLCGFLSLVKLWESNVFDQTQIVLRWQVDMHFYDVMDACCQHSMCNVLSKEKFSQYILGRKTPHFSFANLKHTHTCNRGKSLKRLQTVTFDGHGAPSNNWTVLLLGSMERNKSKCEA